MPLGPSLALAAVLGAILGCLTGIAATDALAAAVASGSVALVVTPGRRPRVRRALVLVCAASALAAEGAVARDRALAPPLAAWLRASAAPDFAASAARTAEPVRMIGVLATDASWADGSASLVVDVTEIHDARGSHQVAGRVQAHVAGALAAGAVGGWTEGRPIRLAVTLRAPRVPRNPGGPSARWQALRRPHQLTGSVKSAALVEVERGAIWDEAAAEIRRRARDAVARHVAPHDLQSAAVVTAILIGDRAGLAPEVERRLQAAGTYHVIAISGGNVALLTSLCFFAFRLILRSRRLVSVLTIAGVLAYGWVVSDDPSVLRAVTAACLVLAVHAAGVRPEPRHLIAAVALLLVVADPLIAIDVGAWLSFGATIGIVIGARPIARWVCARVTLAGRFGAASVARAMATLLAATICAELALLPVQAQVFGRVGVAGLALNFVAIPAMALVQLCGIATVLSAQGLDVLAQAAGLTTHLAAAALLGSARAVEVFPWLSWRVPATSLAWTTSYYACLILVASPVLGAARRRLAAAGLAVIAVVIVTAPGLERGRPPVGVLRVTLVDVGQGDAILVQFPDRHAMLVDAGGSAGSFDVGGRVVTPAAWALGVRRLDWLLVTHPDLDHAGGAVSVVEDLRPREVWEGVPVQLDVPRATLREAARRRDVVWRTVREGHRLEAGGATLEVLHPPEPDWERRVTRNDDSVVVRLRYGQAEFLLTGDAGVEFESSWRPPGDLAPLRLLKVAHHGSRSSSADAFVEGYQADVALVSVGPGNLFGHPHPDVLGRLEADRTAIFRTDRDGAVIIETDGTTVDVRAMSGRSWTLALLGAPP